MGAPETGTEVEVVGSWHTLQVGLPPELTDILGVVQGILEVLLVILNVVLAILQVVKAFLVGFLDPIVAIIQEILDLIVGLLEDIRQMGVYLSGDIANLNPPQFTNIIGGFTAYERRMISRLVDKTDPTRPDLSSQTACLALFCYVSVDMSGIMQLVRLIEKLINFFGKKTPIRAYTVPTGLRVTYGIDGSGLNSFGVMSRALMSGDVPDAANLTWQMAPPPNGTVVKFPSLAPKGFLIEISTVPDGLIIAADVPSQNAQPTAQRRSYSLVRDPKSGLPFQLFGGAYMVDVGDMADPTFTADDGTDTKSRIYAYKNAADNVPIPIDSLVTDDGKFLLQRTFYVRGGFFNVVGPGQGFAATLNAADMPYEAKFDVDGSGNVTTTVEANPATTVYARVSAVTDSIADSISIGAGQSCVPLSGPLNFWTATSADFQGSMQQKGFASLSMGTSADGQYSAGDKTDPSFPLVLTFPGMQTQEYLETVTIAIAVLVLSRSDVALINAEYPANFGKGRAATATGLEEIAKYVSPMVIQRSKWFFGRKLSPAAFRKSLLKRCRAVANNLYSKSGSLGDVEGAVVLAGEQLRTFKWSDVDGDYPDETILESLQSTSGLEGLGLNPVSIGIPDDSWLNFRLQEMEIRRTPGFMEPVRADGIDPYFVMGRGSCDYAPVIYSREDYQMGFCRNVFSEVDGLYAATSTVLNMAGGPLFVPQVPGANTWLAIRLFPQGLWPIEAALQQIIGFVETIMEGIQGVTDLIVKYIEFIEARIIEMQALIVRIIGLLNIITSLEIPSCSGLIVTGNGTDGILQALVSAGDKPSDSSAAYGAGVVMLAGGLPSIIFDILQAIMGGGE